VAKLRDELSLRGLNTKGLKSQLTTRLAKALKEEKDMEMETHVGEETTGPADESFDPGEPESGDQVGSETVEDQPQPVEEQEQDEVEIVSEEIETSSKEAGPKLSGILVPILTPDMDEKTKKIWERRYALPRRPHVLAHPPYSTKAAELDCAKMSVSSLREYRLNDNKETSAEVSIFAEFFHEMLQRDFAFKIYTEALRRSQLPASVSKDSSKKQDKEKVCHKSYLLHEFDVISKPFCALSNGSK
jgi:hypothetical protein